MITVHCTSVDMGESYRKGTRNGKAIRKDDLKALDYFIRSVELGSPEACTRFAEYYHEGNGVAVNKEKVALFDRIGALRGCTIARHNIGSSEYELGNHEIAIRHWKIAAEAGYQDSLNALRGIYNADGKTPGKEFISKGEMDTVYRSGHDAQIEVKSEEREKHSGTRSTCIKYQGTMNT